MTMTTLGDALPKEMKRIREDVIPAYQQIGPAGAFALAMMNNSLTHAEKAMMEGDVARMVVCCEDLKSYEL